jgi:flagellar biosynthesis/type III secretory pathway protein FliH
MRAFAIAAIIASLAVPAFIIASLAVPAFAAEDPSKAEEYKAEAQKRKDAEEIEKAYKDALKRTNREQPVKKADPWGNMR